MIDWIERRGVLSVVVKGSVLIRMEQKNVNYVNITGNRGQAVIIFILYLESFRKDIMKGL